MAMCEPSLALAIRYAEGPCGMPLEEPSDPTMSIPGVLKQSCLVVIAGGI